MPRITRELILRKSEHNEKTIGELEEIALHQLQIERIEVIGNLCRKLKILLLQDNIISKIENVHYMKNLEYLNLAMNNLTYVAGLRACEFLNKLDLTLNFIDIKMLKSSLDELQHNKFLKEFFVLGNPLDSWANYKQLIIFMLPSVKELDGVHITSTERILARQEAPSMLLDLENKTQISLQDSIIETIDTDNYSANTPEERVKMQKELEEKNREREELEQRRYPKKRNYEKEHKERLQDLLNGSEETCFPDGRIKQVNEMSLAFKIFEDEYKYYYEVQTPKFLSTELIHCDVHPTYFTLLVKNKLFRLKFEAEVKSAEARCRRSSVTGLLCLDVDKVSPSIGVGDYCLYKRPKDTRRLLKPTKPKASIRKSPIDGILQATVVEDDFLYENQKQDEANKLTSTYKPDEPPPLPKVNFISYLSLQRTEKFSSNPVKQSITVSKT
eukprot:maker-scaffold_4-snap-gene-16.3-mRNA-1 protein AED:0.22 eAED:0.22 QI:0/0/0/0.5/1/1/2/0/442